MITATPETWVEACAGLASRGLPVVDWLTAIDRESGLELVACFVDPGAGDCELISCGLDEHDPRVPSIAELFPGADWHERETSEMFGVRFDGRVSTKPLLLRSSAMTPLRRASALEARVETRWPGAEPDSGRRRRKLPPGVRPEWSDAHE